MTFIRNIRQKFCKHYFVFDVNKTTADADGLTHRYIFTWVTKRNCILMLISNKRITSLK